MLNRELKIANLLILDGEWAKLAWWRYPTIVQMRTPIQISIKT